MKLQSILRNIFCRGTESGAIIKQRRAEGKIVESDILVKLIADRMEVFYYNHNYF